MKVEILKIFDIINSTRLFVALNSAMVVVFATIIYEIPLDPVLLSAGFMVTLAVYILNTATDSSEDSVNKPENRRGREGYIARSLSLLIVGLGIGITKGLRAFVVLSIPFLVGIAYSIQLLPSIPRLKEVVGVKSLTVAFGWAFTGSLLPTVLQPVQPEVKALVLIYIFIQLLVNTILFDILDIEGDKQAGITTIPVLLGRNRTKRLLLTVNTLLIPWLIYCLMRGLFHDYMPALVFGIFYGYTIIWAFSKREYKRLLVEMAVDGEWIPLVAFMKLF